MEKLIKLEANDRPKSQEHLKKLHSAEFYQSSAQQEFGNRERSSVVVQTKTYVGSTISTQTTSTSAKSLTKQPFHKSPIRPPNCPVGWGCRIHWLDLFRGLRHLPNECPWYDIKQSDSKVPAMLRLWGIRSKPFIVIAPRFTLARSDSTW